MPHLNVIVLPSTFTKHMIYNKMRDEKNRQGMEGDIVKSRRFYQIWEKDEEFMKVKIRKVCRIIIYFISGFCAVLPLLLIVFESTVTYSKNSGQL